MKKLLFIILGLSIATNVYAATFTIQQVINPVAAGFVYSNGTALSTLIASSSPFFSVFSFGNATGTQATTTSLFSSNGTFTNLFGTNITGFGLTSCSGTSALTFSGTTFGCSAQQQGTVTSIATNNGLTGGTITTSGTIGLAAIAANSVLGNITGSSAVPTAIATSSLFQNASASITGLLSSTDWTTFNNKGSGTVTAIGVTTANGVSGSSSGGATPNLTITLGAITPSSVVSSGLGHFGNLWSDASSTLQNFTGLNSTTTNATTTSFAISGIASGNCLQTSTGGAIISAGSACGSGSGGSSYPFPLTGNATSTLTQFNGGLTAYSSTSTINNLTMINSTSTNATTTAQMAFGTGTNFTGINANTANSLDFWSNGLWRGGFSSAGFLGVGTSTPPSELTVATTTVSNASFPIGILVGGRGLASGSAGGTFLGMNAANAFAGNFIDIQNNGVSEFKVGSDGATNINNGLNVNGSGAQINASGNIGTSGGSFTLPSFAQVQWGSSVRIGAVADGNLSITPNTASNGAKLTFNCSTASATCPMLKANGTGLQFRLADDSTFSSTTASTFGAGTTTSKALFGAQGTSGGSAPLLDLATSTGGSVFGVDASGHIYTSGGAPVISSCGTGSPTITGDDSTGTITTGTAAAGCTMTFVAAYASTPSCNVSDDSTASAADISSISTTAVSFGLSVSLSGGHLYYSCSYHK